MKIFGYIGSPNGERSNTYLLVRMMLDHLRQSGVVFEDEILTAADVHIDFCKGCWNCMNHGFCPQDKNDDLNRLAGGFKAADIIVLGSPLYELSLSGQTKVLFDRLCAWSHQFVCAGKFGVTVSTAGNSFYQDKLHEYLEMIMISYGIKPVVSLKSQASVPGRFHDASGAGLAAREAAEKLLPYARGEIGFAPDRNFDMVFKFMKMKLISAGGLLGYERELWEKNGWMDCRTFEQMYRKMKESGQ